MPRFPPALAPEAASGNDRKSYDAWPALRRPLLRLLWLTRAFQMEPHVNHESARVPEPVLSGGKMRRCFSASFVLLSLGWPAPSRSQDGAMLFKNYCAICHEGGDARAQTRDVLSQMSPEQVLQALEKGSMKAQAAERSRAQRRALAEYVSGKRFESEPPSPFPKSAFCGGAEAASRELPAGPAWNGWGGTVTNMRFQPAKAAGITADDVARLKLKWAFGFPGATSGGTQSVVFAGRVYVATAEGDVFSLDARTGCIHWVIEVEAGVRSAIVIGRGTGGLAAYFGDQSANVYAVDAESGKVSWKVKVDEYSRAAITGAPQLYGERLYVPVSSREESQVGDPKYVCCAFRGSVVALDVASGKQIWKTYTIAQEPVPIQKNQAGTQLWGPSGAGIWNAPTVDAKRNRLYVGTGNNYSPPATNASDSIVALDMKSGRIIWVRQATENDIWNLSCRRPDREPAVCPDENAPDFDFGASPSLVELKSGKEMLIAGNKSGVIYALDPNRKGATIWEQQVGKGSTGGGVLWGVAVDGESVYVPNGYFDQMSPNASGGMAAVALSDGHKIWITANPSCEVAKPCKPSHAAAVTAIPGIVFSGSMDGQLRAYSTHDGKILWEFDTAREYATVNGVKANGGSISNAGPAVAGGMLFTNSGYSHHGGIIPGNVLLAFSPN
jgi:polyvinyl alcohol dehydrogenase (cytochrome)